MHVRKPSASGVSAGDDYPQPAPLYCYMHGVAWHPIAGAPSQLRHPCMIVLPVRDLTKIKTQKFDLKKGYRSEVRSAPRLDFYLHRVGRGGRCNNRLEVPLRR